MTDQMIYFVGVIIVVVPSILAFLKPIRSYYKEEANRAAVIAEDRVKKAASEAEDKAKINAMFEKLNDTLNSLRDILNQVASKTEALESKLDTQEQTIKEYGIRLAHGEDHIKDLQKQCDRVKTDVDGLNAIHNYIGATKKDMDNFE